FYDKYAQTTDTHIGKNQVSRTLNALGLKSIMKKVPKKNLTSFYIFFWI
ncbi:1569_t:CDS:2, partial [Entrophospora sp. SA101]